MMIDSNDVKRLAVILAGLTMLIATIMGAMAETVTYDFEDCNTLSECNLTERGANIGLNQTYVTSFDGGQRLYYDGQRTYPPLAMFNLGFDVVPSNVTTVQFDVYPVDDFYAEFMFGLRWSEYWVNDVNPDKQGLFFYNTHYGVSVPYMNYDFNGADYNATCPRINSGEWVTIKMILNYSSQTLDLYYDDLLQPCSLDWSAHAGDVGNLGEYAFLASRSSDNPNVYFDNIVFTAEDVGPVLCDTGLSVPTCFVDGSDLYLNPGTYTDVNITVADGWDIGFGNDITMTGTVSLGAGSRITTFSSYVTDLDLTVVVTGYDSRIYDLNGQEEGVSNVFNVVDQGSGWVYFVQEDRGFSGIPLVAWFQSDGFTGGGIVSNDAIDFGDDWISVDVVSYPLLDQPGRIRFEGLSQSGFDYDVYADGVLQENGTDYVYRLPGAFPGTDNDTLYINVLHWTNWSISLPEVESDSSPGKTRYLVDADGKVVGVQYNQQLALLPAEPKEASFLAIAGGEGFDFKEWFHDLWSRIKGVFQ